WMMVAMPIVCVLLPAVWWWITRGLREGEKLQVPDPGPWRTSEIRLLTILAVTALAWIFRAGPGGGWVAWLPTLASGNSLIGDTTVAIAAVMVMFICPAGDRPERTDNSLDRRPIEMRNSTEPVTARQGASAAAALSSSGVG